MAIQPNVERLRAVLTQIEEHPETWDQSQWHCGSSHCFMGWAQVMSGKRENVATMRRDVRPWLGLTRDQFSALSDASLGLDELRLHVEAIIRADYDAQGYDKEGYNPQGYNRDGYDRDGYDRMGYDRDGYDDEDRDPEGYDRDGYDMDGLDRDNRPRPILV